MVRKLRKLLQDMVPRPLVMVRKLRTLLQDMVLQHRDTVRRKRKTLPVTASQLQGTANSQ